MTTGRGTGDPAVRALGRDLLAQIDGLATRLAARVAEAEAVYRDDRLLLADDLWRSCRDNLEHILTELAGDAPSTVAPARATGRRRAEQGIPLPAILHAYRIGGRFVWDVLLDRADTGAARDALLRTAADVWSIIDDYSEALIDEYRIAIAEHARRDAQVRAAAVGGLLDGPAGGESRLWESAAMLGLPHTGTFVVVVAEAADPGREGLPGVEGVLRRQNTGSAWRLDAAHQIGVVAVRPPVTVATLCQRLDAMATGRVGVSEPYASLDQTPSALRQARLACAAAPGAGQVARYEHHPVGVLLAGAPELAVSLARAVLGPVLALPVPERDLLLDTLRAWFAGQGSASAAAARMHVHRNTVHYRLRRAEALTGRSLTRPAAVGELHLALEAVRILSLAADTPPEAARPAPA